MFGYEVGLYSMANLPAVYSLNLSPPEQDFGNTLFNRLGNMVRQLSEALRAEIEFIEREYDEKVTLTTSTRHTCLNRHKAESHMHTKTFTRCIRKVSPTRIRTRR